HHTADRTRTSRLDPAPASNKNYKVLYVTDNTSRYSLGSLPSCSAPTGTAPAGGEGRATYDIAAWFSALRSSLPSVDAAGTSVAFDTSALATTGVLTVTVRVQWQDNSIDGGENQNVTLVTSL